RCVFLEDILIHFLCTIYSKLFLYFFCPLLFFFFFFLMIRRPPRSTLFPYTTPSDLAVAFPCPGNAAEQNRPVMRRLERGILMTRSEEHTSELQSRFDLVCRLLLEKKNISQLFTRYDTIVVSVPIMVAVPLALLHVLQ